MIIEINKDKIFTIKEIDETIRLEFNNGDKFIITPYKDKTIFVNKNDSFSTLIKD